MPGFRTGRELGQRSRRLRSVRRVATAGGLGLVLALASSAAQSLDVPEAKGLLVASCETTRLEVGLPETRWALGRGVHEDERDAQGRDFAWAEPEWEVLLLLPRQGPVRSAFEGARGPRI